MDKMPIHGGRTFDLGKDGYFTTFDVEILSSNTARFFGETENLHVTFEENIAGRPLHSLLNANWEHADLEKKQQL